MIQMNHLNDVLVGCERVLTVSLTVFFYFDFSI